MEEITKAGASIESEGESNITNAKEEMDMETRSLNICQPSFFLETVAIFEIYQMILSFGSSLLFLLV